MAMWRAGRLFPSADRSPVMIPQSPARLAQALAAQGVPARLREVARVRRGFYISTCLEVAR